jgi:hypothetical protein
MAPDDGHEDPAVYRSGSRRKKNTDGQAQQVESGAEVSESQNQTDQEEEFEEDDSALLTKPPSFNHLLIVLRDERVLRFVKYVSAQAQGSRWDVSGEYEIDMIELEEVDDEPDAGEALDVVEPIDAGETVDAQN